MKIAIEHNNRLYCDSGDLENDPGAYQRLDGKLTYPTITQVDVSYTISVISQIKLL